MAERMATGVCCPVCGGAPGRSPAYREEGWIVLACSECGHGWTWPMPTDEDLVRGYDSVAYYRDRGMPLADPGPSDMARARALRDRFGGESLLDVGSGPGRLLAAAARVGYRGVGSEISPAGITAGRANFGLDIREGSFSQEQFRAEERFDIITMIHVLEHLREPRRSLGHCLRLLRPGGVLIIDVPNREAVGAVVPGRVRRLIFDLPFHLHYFTVRSLQLLLLECGFSVEEVITSVPEPVNRILQLGGLLRFNRGAPPAPHADETAAERIDRLPDGAKDQGRSCAPPGGARMESRGVGAALVRWVRRVLPGYKITAIARPPEAVP